MGGCKCTFRGCTNTSANSPGMHFFHYPLKDHDRCLKWVKYANTMDILDLPFSKARNKVVCECHFKDDCFMNYKKDRLVHYAVPTVVRLSEDYCLDYEESDNPKPKPLLPPSKSHLIPPSSKRKSQMDHEECVLEIFDGCHLETSIRNTKQEATVLNELSPPIKVKKIETPKILNSWFSQNKKVDKNIIMQEDGSIEVLEDNCDSVNIIFEDHGPYNGKKETVDFTDTSIASQNDIKETLASVEVQGETCKITYHSVGRCSEINEQLDNQNGNKNNHIEEIFVDKNMQTEKRPLININKNTACKATSENFKSRIKVINDIDRLERFERNSLNEFLAKERRIRELEKQLFQEINKNKIKESAQAQVEAISTTRQSITSPTASFPKAQLFNNIKKYLSPSMGTLVRMEMFGGPDREWKVDEKQVSVELLRLGDDVFKYMRDEWRFRLPPLKSVEKWLNEYKSDEDVEDL